MAVVIKLIQQKTTVTAATKGTIDISTTGRRYQSFNCLS
jgi:hypothetical protein